MGILDDAIREHLELKRRQGAEEGEIARLEGEAFGPPSRPGDPDFPETTVATASATETQTPASESQEAQAEPAAVEAPAAEAAPVAESAPEAVPELAAEPAQPSIDDQVADALKAPPKQPIEALDTVEHRIEEEPATGEEAATELRPPTGEQPVTGEQPLPPAEPPTGDQPITGEQPLPAVDEQATGEEEIELLEGELEPATGEEDVLEETPEFLRDAPEDDELWFEQGEPKDFDF